MRAAPVALLLGFLVGCAQPTVALNIQPPADQASYDTSCVTTFEIYADGGNYPADANDFTSIEVHLTQAAPTFADVLAAVKGKFDVPIPSTGLSGIEIYGWNGDSGFDDGNVVPELVFYALDKYDGSSDTFDVPLVPNQSCARSTVKLRALDVVSFLQSSPRDCAAGAEAMGGFTLGTLTPAFYKDETFFWGGEAIGATGADGSATITAATTIGPDSCLSGEGGDINADNNTSISCLSSGAGVCGHQGEYELGTFSNTYYTNSVDNALLTKFHGVVLGAVFDQTRASVSGATVNVDPAKGQVVYVDLDPATSSFKTLAGATGTGASGTFFLYTNELLDVTVNGPGGKSATVRMGTINSNADVSTIVL
jgi:hypothetical protein